MYKSFIGGGIEHFHWLDTVINVQPPWSAELSILKEPRKKMDYTCE